MVLAWYGLRTVLNDVASSVMSRYNQGFLAVTSVLDHRGSSEDATIWFK